MGLRPALRAARGTLRVPRSGRTLRVQPGQRLAPLAPLRGVRAAENFEDMPSLDRFLPALKFLAQTNGKVNRKSRAFSPRTTGNPSRKFCVACEAKVRQATDGLFVIFVACDVTGPPKSLQKDWAPCARKPRPKLFSCEIPSSWLTKFVLFEAPLPPLVHFTLLWLRELRVRGTFFV